jgi:hypothetical protein
VVSPDPGDSAGWYVAGLLGAAAVTLAGMGAIGWLIGQNTVWSWATALLVVVPLTRALGDTLNPEEPRVHSLRSAARRAVATLVMLLLMLLWLAATAALLLAPALFALFTGLYGLAHVAAVALFAAQTAGASLGPPISAEDAGAAAAVSLLSFTAAALAFGFARFVYTRGEVPLQAIAGRYIALMEALEPPDDPAARA